VLKLPLPDVNVRQHNITVYNVAQLE